MRRLGPLLSSLLLACAGDPDPTDAGADEVATGDSSDTSNTTESGDSGESADSGESSSSDSGESTDTGSDTTDAGLPPFVHEFHTFLTDDGQLAFESNLPPAVVDCLALPVLDPPCEDLDEDGLADLWEDTVLDRMRPMRRMDEEESLFGDAGAVIADVGRLFLAAPDTYRLFVMLGYSKDYGSCGGFTSHNGDSERVALELVSEPLGGVGGVRMNQAYTAAHEGTITDHGRLFAGAELDQLVIDDDPQTLEPRWVVFPSADKHATYATIDICENISFLPCFDEDCAPDGVDDPAAYDLLPEVANAGELAAPRIGDLGPVGFPGDDAWADQDFCGGLGGSGCSSSVRSKLITDPF